jgi:hypothetical protein
VARYPHRSLDFPEMAADFGAYVAGKFPVIVEVGNSIYSSLSLYSLSECV